MVRIPGFHCIARGSIPGWRTESLASHTAQPKQKEGRKDERKKENVHTKTHTGGTSLVVQGLRIPFVMQEMRVQSLVRELRSHMPQKTPLDAVRPHEAK